MVHLWDVSADSYVQIEQRWSS